MPRLNTSQQVKQRTRQLLEKLLNFANYELPESEAFLDKLTVRWKNETSSTPELVVETELKVLIQLTFEQQESPRLKDQLRNDLRVLEEFLEILEDNRARTQGAKHWRFTLKLWDKSTQANLEAFEKVWDHNKKTKYKRPPYGSILNPVVNVPNLSNTPAKSASTAKTNTDESTIPSPSEKDTEIEEPHRTVFPQNEKLDQTHPSSIRYVNLKAQTSIHNVNQAYLNHLLNLLSFDQPAHLITLEGIGGVGKTTLAIEAAQRCLKASESADTSNETPTFEAIIFTSAQTQHFTGPKLSPRLGRQRNLQDIFRTIFRTLDRLSAVPPDFEEQIEYIRDCLGQQKTLLIVDNLETLEDRDMVLSFLQEIPIGVKVIVTSRVRLGLGTTLHIDPLSTQDAIDLIHQQAKTLELDLSQGQLRQIYSQTGGLPLAITYTLGLMSAYGLRPTDINIGKLTEPKGDFARHCFEASVQRLRGQHSYELLKAFALFRRPAHPEALAHVAFASGSQRSKPQAFKELYRLSLVESQQGRYTMHSLTREYARAELTEDLIFEQEARSRWIEWYLEFLNVNGQVDWYDWHPPSPIEDEWENLREVIEWCQSQGDYETFLFFWDYLKGYTQIYGHWTERLDWMKWLISEAEKQLDRKTLANAMYHYSRTLQFFNQSELRKEAIEVANRTWELIDVKDWKSLINITVLLSTLHTHEQDFHQALEWIKRGDALLKKVPLQDKVDTHQWVNFPYYSAEIYLKAKNNEKARELYNLALERSKKVGLNRAKAYIQGELAVIEMEAKNYDEAERLLESVLPLAKSHNDIRCLAFCCSHLAKLNDTRGNRTQSVQYANLAKKHFTALNMNEQAIMMQSLIDN